MKKVTSFKLQVINKTLSVLWSYGLMVLFLCAFTVASAQVDETRILDSATIQRNELKITPELEEMVVTKIKNLPESKYSDYGITDKEQLVNLHLGKPIPWYQIMNENLLGPVNALNVSRLADGETLSLIFTDRWNVPVMSAGEPLVFVFVGITDREYTFLGTGYMGTRNSHPKVENTIEHIYNYEHKDLLMGSFEAAPLGNGLDFLMIRKENKDVFVEVYNETTDEYCKNEYGSCELMKLLKERATKLKEFRSRYYAYVANKTELIITPEIKKMVINEASRLRNSSDNDLNHYGIKNRAQLENVYPGKPIPQYIIENEDLTFTGEWDVFVMSAGEHLFLIKVKLEGDGQYRWVGTSPFMVETIQNYEHKDLIMGSLKINPRSGWDYLIIRKDNKDIFVKTYDESTREFFKTEYSFSDIINLLKK